MTEAVSSYEFEAVAEAAGFAWRWHCAPIGRFFQIKRRDLWEFWNPTLSNEDSFQLAVALKIDVKHYSDHTVAWYDDFFGSGKFPYGDDPCTATRRAIWRAAVEKARDATPQPSQKSA